MTDHPGIYPEAHPSDPDHRGATQPPPRPIDFARGTNHRPDQGHQRKEQQVTDTQTTTPAQAGEELLDALRRRFRRQAADVSAAADQFCDAAAGSATEEALIGVRSAVVQAMESYQRTLQHMSPLHAERMGDQQIPKVAAAIDQAVHPFAKLDELHAAEQELRQRETAARDAMAELEAAVEAGDVGKVMTLRGEVEVGHPRRVAEARKALLRLQIEQAEALTEPGARRVRDQSDAVDQAKTRHARAVAELQAATEDAGRTALVLEAVRGVGQQLDERVKQMRAELTDLENRHEQEMQSRLRRIAGLPDLAAESDPEPEQPRGSLVSQRVTPHAPGNRADFYPQAPRRPGPPVLDLTPSESTIPAPVILTD